MKPQAFSWFEIINYSDEDSVVSVQLDLNNPDSALVGARVFRGLLILGADRISGRMDIDVTVSADQDDLASWGDFLDELEARTERDELDGFRFFWPAWSKSSQLEFFFDEERDDLTIHDRTGIRVGIPLGFSDSWISESRARLTDTREIIAAGCSADPPART